MRDNLILVQAAGNGSADACEWTFGDESSYPAGSDEYVATAKAVIVGGSDEVDGRWTCLKRRGYELYSGQQYRIEHWEVS